jgi:hypothetical protein
VADTKKPQKHTFAVTSAFVWDKEIKKPGDTVELTDAEAHGLKNRGKIEDPESGRKKAATRAKKAETTDPAKAPA